MPVLPMASLIIIALSTLCVFFQRLRRNLASRVWEFEGGGLHSAEALLLARYFMYQQLYFHPVRRIYDIHLMDFLAEWLPNGKFSVDPREHLSLTDNEVTAAIRDAANHPEKVGHIHARRIIDRQHFKLLYTRSAHDAAVNPDASSERCQSGW